MRSGIAVVLMALMPLVGAPAIGQAQSSLQVQGVLQSVDCENGTVTVDTGNGPNTVDVAPYGTLLVNSSSTPLCSLDEYDGASVNLWLVPSGDAFEIARLDVVGDAPGTPAPGTPAPPAPATTVAPLSIAGVVLGTVAVAGLTYLLVHGPDGGYYRYPYYGAYYQYYYRPTYRPFVGVVPGVAPVVTVPAAITGVVLGTVVVGGLAYAVSRDAAGRYYRYPYYGPYRQYYGSRPEFRPYGGAWNNAPVQQGNSRWDHSAPTQVQRPGTQPAPTYRDPAQTQPYQSGRPGTQPTPTYQGPTQTLPDQSGRPGTQPTPTYRGPAQTQPYQYGRPGTQPAPTYRGPAETQPYQYGRPGTQPAPTYRPDLSQTPGRTNRGSFQDRGGDKRSCDSQGQSCPQGR